jgi:uncharacterized protein (TIGR02246 family)
MKKLCMILPLIFLLCFTFSCQQGKEVAEEPVVDVEADIEAIKNVSEKWEVAYNDSDIDSLMSLYADNSVRIPANQPPVIGKEAIRNSLQQEFDLSTNQEDDVVVEAQVSGDLAFTRGTWINIVTPKAGGESHTLNGNWITILKRQPDGPWKIINEMWSDESLVSPTQSEE